MDMAVDDTRHDKLSAEVGNLSLIVRKSGLVAHVDKFAILYCMCCTITSVSLSSYLPFFAAHKISQFFFGTASKQVLGGKEYIAVSPLPGKFFDLFCQNSGLFAPSGFVIRIVRVSSVQGKSHIESDIIIPLFEEHIQPVRKT